MNEKDVKTVSLALAESSTVIFEVKDDRPFEDVPVPEWNCMIRIKAMPARQAIVFSTMSQSDPTVKQEGMCRIVAACAVNSKNELLFPDFTVLMDRSVSALNVLQDAAMRVCKFNTPAAAVKKA
jgi:hypothetical protein